MAKKAYIGIQNFTPRSLPEGYTQIEYIETSGTQYIDTGFIPNNNTAAEAIFSSTQTTDGAIFAQDTDWCINGFGLWATCAEWGTTYTSSNFNSGEKVTVKMDKNNLYKNGSLIWTATDTTFSAEYTLTIGALHRSTGMSEYFVGKIYGIKIWDNGTLIRDYVPCKNKSGNIGLYDKVKSSFYENAGTGTFDPGQEYGGIARKVKKMYVGVNGIARKIKKAYVGIEGKARLWWGSGELAYYGTIDPLETSGCGRAATTVGDYAIFAGGTNATATDVYDKNLTHTTIVTLSTPRVWLAATTVGNYAIFAGGEPANGNYTNAVEAYDKSLTKNIITGLQDGRYSMGCTTVGDYAIFAGGLGNETDGSYYYTYCFNVDAYNASLTRTIPAGLGTYRRRGKLSATAVGNYAIIGPGRSYSDTVNNYVDAYDTSLTKTVLTNLSSNREEYAATTVGGYALFGGGTYDYVTNVDAYDESLTRSRPTDLSIGRANFCATTVGDYAIFGAGEYAWVLKSTNVVDAYDKNLVRSIPTPASEGRINGAATTVGDYALFGAGQINGNPTFNTTVDVYTV